jgi:hypothetical protein
MGSDGGSVLAILHYRSRVITLRFLAAGKYQELSLFDVPSRYAQINNKTGERFSQAQQYIIQLYNCHKVLIIFLRHVSTLY